MVSDRVNWGGNYYFFISKHFLEVLFSFIFLVNRFILSPHVSSFIETTQNKWETSKLVLVFLLLTLIEMWPT